MPTEVGPTVCCEAREWCNSVGGVSSGNTAWAHIPLWWIRLRSNVLDSQSLPGFGSREGDRSEESLGWVLKLGLHTWVGKGKRLLWLCLSSEGLGLGCGLCLYLALGVVTSLLSRPLCHFGFAPLSFLNQNLSFRFWTLLGAHHTCDAVWGHPHPAWAVKCHAGKHPWLHVRWVMKAEPTGPFQRLTHGSSLSKKWALTFTLLRVKSPIGVRMVPGSLGLVGWQWVPVVV